MAAMRIWTVLWLLCTLLPIVVTSKKEDNKRSNYAFSSSGLCVDEWCNVRLPGTVIPYHYSLFMKADTDRLIFQGYQRMYITITKATDVILFHAKEMDIRNISMKATPSGAAHVVARHFSYPENEYYVVAFRRELIPGQYVLAMEFSGNISRKLTGFYRSTYVEDGVEQVLLTTKFQPTDARRAFPCFDEPDMKATYNITIQHPMEYTARSNMPGVTFSTTNSTWATTVFPQTVRMSTYLVGFIVSKFESEYEGQSGLSSNVTVAIWSRPEYTPLTHYAFNMSMRMLSYIEGFLNSRYTMPKLDMFAIPDYGSGATEHWGIITYRETYLLYEPGVSSSRNKFNTASIIAHEIAHLWFGNLVTCKWWNDLWVQEGLASYLEYYLVNDAHPEWNHMDNFFTHEVMPGLQLDALTSSQSLSQHVHNPSQIKELFGVITYRKGASLFGMLDSFLGTQLFRQGLNRYLSDNMYKGAMLHDLWNAFSNVSDVDISHIMNSWTNKVGFPLINITRVGNHTFKWSQRRFYINPFTKPLMDDTLWVVPFVYATSDNLTHANVTILEGREGNITSSADWLIGNFHHKGFYRVNYDKNGWEYIIMKLTTEPGVFSATDRAGILDDAFALARAGAIPYSIPFRMLDFIPNEESDIVWNVVLQIFSFLDTALNEHDNYGLFRAKFAELLRQRLETKPTPGVFGRACRAGEKNTISSAQSQFREWMEEGTSIPADFRKQVYFCAVANGGDSEWDYVYEQYMNSTIPSERSNLLFALSGTRKPWILNKWLRYTMDSTKVRPQDMVYVISNIARNNELGKYFAWDFAERHWEDMMAVASENNFHVNVLTSGLTARFSTTTDLQKVNDLWMKYPNAGSGLRAREQGWEKIKTNIIWLNRNSEEISRLLQDGM